MPEGPECYRMAQKLHEWTNGRIISSFEITGGRYLKHGLPAGMDSVTCLNGKKVLAVNCKGKLIYWILDNDLVILNTLGLKGTWNKSQSKHADIHIVFNESEEKPRRAWFKDQIHYGTIQIVTYDGLQKKLKTLGWDCLKPVDDANDGMSLERWNELCKKKESWTFPKLLMNQNCISGIGNYLKAEILYEAKVSPHKRINECSEIEKMQVYEATVSIPKHALMTKLGTNTGKSFRLKVYGRKKDSRGNVVKREKTTDNRTTHWVSEICS